MGCVLGRDMQFPAKLADITDAYGQYRRRAERVLTAAGKGQSRIAHVLLRNLLQHLAGEGSAEVYHCAGGSDVSDYGAPVGRQVAADPVQIVRAEGAAGDDVVLVVIQARQREVAFDAAALVAKLGVDDTSDRFVDIGRGESLQRGRNARP